MIVAVMVMLFILISIVYVSWRNGVSPMPASSQVRIAVAREVNRLGDKQGTIVDAGSGFGTLGVHIALHCPNWTLIGIENSPIPLWISRMYWRLMAAIKGIAISKATFFNENLYTYSYDEVNTLVCYLYPGAMKRIGTSVCPRLASGTRIISICFALPGREALHIITCKDLYRTKVYVYEI